MCLANSLATFGFFTPSFGNPDFSDLKTSAALIPEAVTTRVCGAPVGLAGVACSFPPCFFKNGERFSKLRVSVQVLVSLMVHAVGISTDSNMSHGKHTRYESVLQLYATKILPVEPCP